MALLVAALAILANSNDLRARYFANLFAILSKDDSLDNYRCNPAVKALSGRVLEIGPGSGANFRCWRNNNQISQWEGIEVNQYFNSYLAASHAEHEIKFPMRMNWIDETASNLSLEASSYDAVVMTHVLCSVSEVNAVLGTIERALKPGASLYFMEHVAATNDQRVAQWQAIFAPFLKIIGNGCEFKDTAMLMERAVSRGGLLEGYESNITHFEAPLPLLPLKPHIFGTLTKPMKL